MTSLVKAIVNLIDNETNANIVPEFIAETTADIDLSLSDHDRKVAARKSLTTCIMLTIFSLIGVRATVERQHTSTLNITGVEIINLQ